MNVAGTLCLAGRATHRAGAPAAKMLVWPLIDAGSTDVQRVDVHPGPLDLSVRESAGQYLLHERRTRLAREIQQLERLCRGTTANEVHHHPRLARTDALKIAFCLTDHVRQFPGWRPVAPLGWLSAEAGSVHSAGSSKGAPRAGGSLLLSGERPAPCDK